MSSSTIDKNDKKDSTGSAFTFDDEVSSDDEMLQPGKVKNFKEAKTLGTKTSTALVCAAHPG